ncbi:hypothetical protein LOTGIDRAFT_151934 [Lottia gigantea]|uniref:EF-hand domain-containing protein n=1 Tax=Lottia gigantea TaxID=225164 RepID=V4B3X9_LOTGI|nr:hypothetical protein LOTGIDRAFT_151934 [Lottia gigantea]ESP05133.1 hypothetical protein LOTGIDRAFT_151934 [Lottia gigantea]
MPMLLGKIAENNVFINNVFVSAKYESQLKDRPTIYSRESPSKRSDRFVSFSRFMARQSPRYRDDQLFVEKMFRLFDMNDDDVIERDEFRAILQLFGIVSHTF